MTQAVQKWIANRIGLVLNMSPDIFSADVMDGIILARILHSYNIITQEQLVSILPTNNHNVAFNNLKRLNLWMKAQGIACSEDDLYDISTGSGSSAVKVFYQLYLELHDKDKLHYVAKKKVNEALVPNDTRFDVIPVKETLHDPTSNSDHPFSEPLIVRKDVKDWSLHRYKALLDDYAAMREKYSKYIQDKYSIKYHDKFVKVKLEMQIPEKGDELNERFPEFEDCSYEDLVEQQKAALEMESFVQDPKVAKKILNTIKQKRQREATEKELKLHQQKLLLLQLWGNLLREQEKEFEELISQKLLKQSEFEKQMTTKMSEVRQQKQTILENRKFIDDETMKMREAEFLENVFLREKSTIDQKFNYYFERNRTLELHRRLYAEKMRLKAERHYNMCWDAMNDIVDIAMRHVEYKRKFGEEVVQRVQKEWENLFVKQQPIFDILDEVEDIAQDADDIPEELEDIYQAEIDRQNSLDQRDFENYFNFEWPWKLEDLLDYEEDLLPLELGMNVLGHNVHRVLLTKYPKPKPPPKPDIPKPTIAACVNSLPDLTILPLLQKLLDQKKIKVIEMQQAINFCLDAFNEEIRTEYIDRVLVQETEQALKELKGKAKDGKSKDTKKDKKSQKGEKTKGKGKKGKQPAVEDSALMIPKVSEKESQTPRLFPCEEIVLSSKGELGKIAYDVLNIGEQLTDNLIVAMFIEYLKELKSVDGWVLINFPTTMGQAALLEEALTGIKVPGISDEIKLYSSMSIGNIADLDYRESQWEQEEKNAILRKSKILPDPEVPWEEPFYETYLTAYIRAMYKDEQREQLENETESDPLENFYMDQGCNYAFFYKSFELATVKHLAKLVIGDFSIPAKQSLELFGDTVLFVEANLQQQSATPGKESTAKKKGEKKEKPPPKKKGKGKEETEAKEKGGKKDKSDKKSKSDKKEKGKGKGKKEEEKEPVVREDKETQIPEPQPEVEEIYEEPYVPPKAGELQWRYADIRFPENLQLALATLWENAEDVYICDIKELFFIKRIILNAVVPYLSYVRNHIEEYIARPDNKQTYLSQFQTLYNEIDADMRDDVELKAEVHCRIAEFREKLWEICDRRMRESEEERQTIIKESWAPVQVGELINNYISAMQLEIDRACDTFQFITDFYCGVITKMPSDEYVMHKTGLNRIEVGPNVSFDGNINKSALTIRENLKETVNYILTVPESDSTDTPFHKALIEVLEVATKAAVKWKSISYSAVTNYESIVKPRTAKDKKDKSKKDKGSSKKPASEKKLPKFAEPDPVVLEAGSQLVEEWRCALEGEYLRVNLRLNMLAKRGEQDLNDVLNCSKRIFHDLYNKIYERYNREIQSVDTACEVLAAAVEAETPLQPELILEGDKFYIDPNVLLFPEPLPLPAPPPTEPKLPGVFTISQLETLRNILMDLAPDGTMPERAFVFLLQDMIVQNSEDGAEPMVPVLWRKLQPSLVSLLSKEIFGNVEFVDWKDFIIMNLSVDFPTEEELMETRSYFRENDPDATETVKDYHLYRARFWFEGNFDKSNLNEMLRLKLIKELLFKLYKINEDTVNYTALLLDFCKDADPVKGFAKALALALGKFVCWDESIGTTFIRGLIEQRTIDKQIEFKKQHEHKQAVQNVESLFNKVVDETVHRCESVVIEDYVSETQLEEDAIEVSEEQTFGRKSSDFDVEFAKLLEEIYVNEGDFNESETKTQGSLLMEQFSNVEIGFQPSYNSAKVYFMPLEVLSTVLAAALPWQIQAQTDHDRSLRERLEGIFESLKNPQFGNAVLTHQILNDSRFKKLLLCTSKFTAKNLPKVVARMVEASCGVCCADFSA